MLFLGYSAQAQTYVDLNATGANNGSSWADAFTNLQAGIDATAAGQSVFVAKGVYTAPAFGSFDIKEGVKIYGSFQGTETTLGDRIFGTNAGDTSVLKGDDMIVYSLNLTNASILDGFKITDGQTGIFNDNSNPSLSNLTVTLIAGNGIFNMDSNPTISNSIISANEVNGIFNFNSSPTLTNVLISGNEENGIENIDNSALILKNVTITGNLLAGIANDDNSTVVAHNSIILGNTSGIINDGSSTATTQYSLVQGSSDILNGNLDATGILTSTIFVDPIAPGNSAAGDYAAKPCAITVDAGSNALVTAGVNKDLAGNARIFNTTVDMGAYELDFIPVAITSTVDTTDCGTLVYNGLTQ